MSINKNIITIKQHIYPDVGAKQRILRGGYWDKVERLRVSQNRDLMVKVQLKTIVQGVSIKIVSSNYKKFSYQKLKASPSLG